MSSLVISLVTLIKFPIWNISLSWDCVKYYFCYSGVSERLILLTIFVYVVTGLRRPRGSRPGSANLCLIWRLSLILMACFRSSKIFHFYFLFEASLIPMFFLILGWGYQPERLPAGVCLLLYTVLASLPLLLLLAVLTSTENVSNFIDIHSTGSPYSLTTGRVVIGRAAVIGFLVKLPIYWFHLWLPKAHVEAPVAGSMVLASILLKLGGYGLFRFFKIIDTQWTWSMGVARFAIFGGAWIGLLCARQTDIKVLIAYSSVSHISIVIYGLLTGSALGLWARVRLMLAHGVASSGLFIGANVLYSRSYTRRLLLTKNFINVLPSFSLFWFILCLANIGGPPTLNLLREVLSFVLACGTNTSSLIPFSIIAARAVAYSLILYSLRQHGLSSTLSSPPKTLTLRELSNLYYHSLLTILLVILVATLLG